MSNKIKPAIRHICKNNKILMNGYKMVSKARVMLFKALPDETVLRYYYRVNFGRKLDLKNPKTYNEKIQWLKLYYRKPEQTMMVDKYLVKEFVSKKIGFEHVIPTLGKWNMFDEIDFDSLPNQFVLKCNHDCGSVIVCKDKGKFNKIEAKKKLDKALKRNYYWGSREWPYKKVVPCIFAEKYMEDKKTGDLRDYKFFTFNGKVKCLFIASDRMTKGSETKFDFFDRDFNHLDIRNGHPNSKVPIEKPENYEEMIYFAELLSEGTPHLRVDFYSVNGKTYFGELTFAHWGGMVPFEPKYWDEVFGNWIVLPYKSLME